MTKDQLLGDLRRQRDEAAARGDSALAFNLNDRIKDLEEGRCSLTVERVMKQFESALARRVAYGQSSTH